MTLAKTNSRSRVKKGPWRSKAYRNAVKEQPCIVCLSPSVEAHHIREMLPRTMGKRVGDEWCVPLCSRHHRDLHKWGHADWWEWVHVDALQWCKDFNAAYTRSEANHGAAIAKLKER